MSKVAFVSKNMPKSCAFIYVLVFLCSENCQDYITGIYLIISGRSYSIDKLIL